MAPRFPSIPEPGNDPATQLNTLRVIKQVVELLAANATGDKNPSGPGQGAQIFALQDDVKRLIQQEAASRAQADDGNKKDITWTVDEAVADLNRDISDARNRAIQARADALQALDEFENGTFLQTVYDINQEIGDAKGQISEKYGLSVEADKVLSGRIAKSAAYVGLNEATWKEGDLSVATRFSAMSTGYKEYVARTGDDFLASYTSHIVTTTDFTSAITTKLDQLEAKLTVPSTPGRNPLLLSSAIITESNLTTDATKKISTAQNLQTTIASLSDVAGQNGKTTNGAITAAVKVESDARVSALNNIKSTAAYSVTVDTTGPAGPAITGFRAVSDSTSNTPISDFAVYANKFKVTNGTTARQVFSVDTVTNEVRIDGNLIVTGSISSRQISEGAVSNVAFISGIGTENSRLQLPMIIRPGSRVQITGVYTAGDTASSNQNYANTNNDPNTNKPSKAQISTMGNVKMRIVECTDVSYSQIIPSTDKITTLPVLGYLQSSNTNFVNYFNNTYFYNVTWTYSSFSVNNILFFKNNTASDKYLVFEMYADFISQTGFSLSVTELVR